ncbi:MAG TPA: ribonuclease T2 [Pseudolabrys sp.]|nr:ribonuclease T2 [Pseudolabrys sp.]
MFNRIGSLLAIVFAVLFLSNNPVAFAQSGGRNQPGKFDFYVLALSWSPTFCDSQRTASRQPDPQCGARPYAFVVHGLWPQYEHGYPSYCQVPAPRLDRTTVSSVLDVMPSPRLVFHEWDRHGTCSGMNAQNYFAAVHKARAAVKIPPQYVALAAPLTVTPAEVEDAFAKANPGLSRSAMAVVCDSKRLREIRVCLGKNFGFHDCAEVARATCQRASVLMPPMRGQGRSEAAALQPSVH